MKTSWVASSVLPCLAALALQGSAQASPADVNSAVTLIRAVCTLPGASLDLKPTQAGRLELRIALSDGQRRSVLLANADVDTFSEAATVAMTRMPMQTSACMDPYLTEVVGILSNLPPRPGAEPPPPFVPPTGAPPGLPPPPAAPPPTATPPRPALPATGDLPVGAVNNPGSAAPVAVARPGTEVAFRVAGCRAAGRDVVCDIKISNTTGQDSRVVLQGSYTRLYGADGSEIHASWVVMGNQRDDVRYGSHQSVMKVISDTSPVMNVIFHAVPETLSSIKRLEVSVGPQTTSGTDLQKITMADVPIQGR